MVDCGSRRCAQERRSLRRDLQSLSKKLPVILGLESIATVFAKENKSEEQTEEQTNPQCRDFQSSSHCFYCDKKLPNVYKRIHRIINDAQNGKENKGKLCLRSLQDLIPFCLDFYTHGFGRELFSDCVKNYFTTVPLPEAEEEPHHPSSSSTSSFPTTAGSSSGSQPGFPTNPNHALNIPTTGVNHARPTRPQQPTQSHSFKPLSSSSSSRCVDERRLDCKRDAMSMLHHHHRIPDTLMEETSAIKQESDGFHQENSLGALPAEAADLYSMFFSQLPHLDPRKKNHHHPPLDYNDLHFPFALQNFLLNSPLMHPAYLSHDVTLLKELHLAQIRRMHNLDGANKSQPRPAHGSQLKMPILINIVRKLVREKFAEIKKKYHRMGGVSMLGENLEGDDMLSDPHRPPFMPFPSSLFSLGYPENERRTDLYNGSHFSPIALEDGHQLKHFGKVNECSRIGSTLKDIIVKSIAEKVKLKEDSSDENSCPSSPNFSDHRQLSKSGMSHSHFSSIPSLVLKSLKNESASTSQVDLDYGCSPPKRVKKDATKSGKCNTSSKKSSPDANSPPQTVKKTRPKRGQYRKYNSQLLMDAVRAVQSGEMSVHRAGSFFGVPHSTLEYKVKERHLLRQKKVKDSRASPVSSSSPKSDHQQSSLRLTIDLSRDSSPALSEVSMCTTPSSLKKSESLPLSSVVNLDKKKPSPVSFLDHKASEQLSSSSPTPSALSSSSSCASNRLNNNNSSNGKKDNTPASSSAAWFQPYLSSEGTSSASDVPAEMSHHHSIPSLLLDNSASELLRKLQHKVQTSSSKLPSFPSSPECGSISQLPSLSSSTSDFVSLDSGTAALAGRMSVFNQSA